MIVLMPLLDKCLHHFEKMAKYAQALLLYHLKKKPFSKKEKRLKTVRLKFLYDYEISAHLPNNLPTK